MTFPKLLWFKFFFPWLFQAWKMTILKIPWLFQVFHDRTNTCSECSRRPGLFVLSSVRLHTLPTGPVHLSGTFQTCLSLPVHQMPSRLPNPPHVTHLPLTVSPDLPEYVSSFLAPPLWISLWFGLASLKCLRLHSQVCRLVPWHAYRWSFCSLLGVFGLDSRFGLRPNACWMKWHRWALCVSDCRMSECEKAKLIWWPGE